MAKSNGILNKVLVALSVFVIVVAAAGSVIRANILADQSVAATQDQEVRLRKLETSVIGMAHDIKRIREIMETAISEREEHGN